MKPDRFARLKELLIRAEDLPEEQRKAYLDEACQDDSGLRDQIDTLLARGDDPDQAYRLAKKAARSDPENPDVLLVLARVASTLNRVEDASQGQ